MMNNFQPGIYLIIEFDWPQSFEEEYGKLARTLHDALQNRDWIR